MFFFSINAEQLEDHFIEKDLFFKLFFLHFKSKGVSVCFHAVILFLRKFMDTLSYFLCHFGDLSKKRIQEIPYS